MRCLKRYVARDIYRVLVKPDDGVVGDDLRVARLGANISLQMVASALGTLPPKISQLERGLRYDTNLTLRYVEWLESLSKDAGGAPLRVG